VNVLVVLRWLRLLLLIVGRFLVMVILVLLLLVILIEFVLIILMVLLVVLWLRVLWLLRRGLRLFLSDDVAVATRPVIRLMLLLLMQVLGRWLFFHCEPVPVREVVIPEYLFILWLSLLALELSLLLLLFCFYPRCLQRSLQVVVHLFEVLLMLSSLLTPPSSLVSLASFHT